MDVAPQLDLKFSNTRWSKSSGVRLRTLAAEKRRRRVWINIFPLVHTNGSVKIPILFLPRLALLQSPRTKYWVAWLVFIKFVGRVCHQWHTSAIPLKTLQPCDVIQEDLQNCTSQVNINGSTRLQLHHQWPSNFGWSEIQGEWRHQQLWTTMTLGWIGLTPHIARC
jgi:hypothetical protein